MYRYLAAALVFTTSACAFDVTDSVRKSAPVSSATRLTFRAEFGSINVQSGSGKTVDVEAEFRGYPSSRAEFDRMLHDFDLQVTQRGSDIEVNGTFRAGWEPRLSVNIFDMIFGNQICHNGRCLKYTWLRSVDYRITTPQQFNADVATSGGSISVGGLKGEVTAHTAGGSLHFDRIDGPVNGSTSGGSIVLAGAKGRAVVHTSGGSIQLRDVGGDVDASTSGGSITVDGVTGYVKAHTSGGHINANEVSGAIDASTSGGGVTATLLTQPKQDCRLTTSGGRIDVTLAGDIHLDLDASTSGGGIRTDFDVPFRGERHPHDIHAPINGGGPQLYLHTSGGGIVVHRGGPHSL
ncbi:MAG TPA: hypothetical protein VG297_16225 [Bryobacteraceae bacterium]|nr:hypothetical protein [Bryobacteraceae bacterium]